MTRKKEGLAPRVSNAGHQDIYINRYGTFSVKIRGINVGTYKTIEKAISERDEYRNKHNLPAAKY